MVVVVVVVAVVVVTIVVSDAIATTTYLADLHSLSAQKFASFAGVSNPRARRCYAGRTCQHVVPEAFDLPSSCCWAEVNGPSTVAIRRPVRQILRKEAEIRCKSMHTDPHRCTRNFAHAVATKSCIYLYTLPYMHTHTYTCASMHIITAVVDARYSHVHIYMHTHICTSACILT